MAKTQLIDDEWFGFGSMFGMIIMGFLIIIGSMLFYKRPNQTECNDSIEVTTNDICGVTIKFKNTKHYISSQSGSIYCTNPIICNLYNCMLVTSNNINNMPTNVSGCFKVYEFSDGHCVYVK